MGKNRGRGMSLPTMGEDVTGTTFEGEQVNDNNNLDMSKPLADVISDEIETGTVTQYVNVTVNGTTRQFTIQRDLYLGGNISDVEQNFENLPSLDSNGRVVFDDDLSDLENVFSSEVR